MDPNLRPEKQYAIPIQGRSEKPQVGQGRAGLRRRRPDHMNQPSDVKQGIPGGSEIETGKTKTTQGTNCACDRTIDINNPFCQKFHYTWICSINLHQNTNKITTILTLIWILSKICHFKKAS